MMNSDHQQDDNGDGRKVGGYLPEHRQSLAGNPHG